MAGDADDEGTDDAFVGDASDEVAVDGGADDRVVGDAVGVESEESDIVTNGYSAFGLRARV